MHRWEASRQASRRRLRVGWCELSGVDLGHASELHVAAALTWLQGTVGVEVHAAPVRWDQEDLDQRLLTGEGSEHPADGRFAELPDVAVDSRRRNNPTSDTELTAVAEEGENSAASAAQVRSRGTPGPEGRVGVGSVWIKPAGDAEVEVEGGCAGRWLAPRRGIGDLPRWSPIH